jgi:6-pyruvoyltetrahydropterin/6-carboxytetrahydropterin synthase
MYQLRINGDFAAAHFLKNYHGKCENLHGHNYKVRIYLSGSQLDAGGMLIDFGIVKGILKDVLAGLDHSNLNEHPFFSSGNPSAERIARYIYEEMVPKIPSVKLDRVEVFETENNVASYLPD